VFFFFFKFQLVSAQPLLVSKKHSSNGFLKSLLKSASAGTWLPLIHYTCIVVVQCQLQWLINLTLTLVVMSISYLPPSLYSFYFF